MPENLKTPGVYIVEKDSGANAIVQVATAVPVFIGFTEKAEVNGVSFHMKPVIVSSLSEFEIFFGGAPKPVFTVKEADEKKEKGILIWLSRRVWDEARDIMRDTHPAISLIKGIAPRTVINSFAIWQRNTASSLSSPCLRDI